MCAEVRSSGERYRCTEGVGGMDMGSGGEAWRQKAEVGGIGGDVEVGGC